MDKAIVCWSGGKDSALSLWRARNEFDIVALITTVTEEFDRVSMHGVRRSLLQQQAEAIGISLHVVTVPWPCTNAIYEERMKKAFAEYLEQGVNRVICGDIFLEDVRKYREERLLTQGQGVFPIWGENTHHLMQTFLTAGFEAVLCCVDTERLPGEFAGRRLDASLVNEFAAGIDPCGENGEYHSFVFNGPIFSEPVPFAVGEKVLRDGRFMYCDLIG